jgi:hypothetical protein
MGVFGDHKDQHKDPGSMRKITGRLDSAELL